MKQRNTTEPFGHGSVTYASILGRMFPTYFSSCFPGVFIGFRPQPACGWIFFEALANAAYGLGVLDLGDCREAPAAMAALAAEVPRQLGRFSSMDVAQAGRMRVTLCWSRTPGLGFGQIWRSRTSGLDEFLHLA